MEDKSKGFSLRQKKSKRIPNISGPKPISAPIQNYGLSSKENTSSQRSNINGRNDAGKAADLVKRRYSQRFNDPNEYGGGTLEVPGLPTLPDAFQAQSGRTAPTSTATAKLSIDTSAFKDPKFDAAKYSSLVLADATDQDLQDYQNSLKKWKHRASTNMQQNVYKNRTQFIKISKEAEKLKEEMRTLRGLMAELTIAVNQASINSGAADQRATADEGARTRARKQANRSSVANLEAMWSTQLHALWKNVEGSQKFLPAIPGRHVVTEQSHWIELDPATWKAKRTAHMFLLNDHLMIATRKKKRIDPNDPKSGQSGGVRIVADKCWPLQDIDMVDLASMSRGIGDRSGMSNAISIRCGHESFTYRSDKSSNTEKLKLLQEFRRTSDDLRKALRVDLKEQSSSIVATSSSTTALNGDKAIAELILLKQNEHHAILESRDVSTQAYPDELLRKLSTDKSRPEIMIEVDGKHQNLRWVEGQFDELGSEIALHRVEDAVRRIEKLQKIAKSLKAHQLAQVLVTNKLDFYTKQLTDKLILRLNATHGHLAKTQTTTSQLSRLNAEALARTTYLDTRTRSINTRARSIVFEGDLRHHIFQLSFVYFTLMCNTVRTFRQCFPPTMMSTCIHWARDRLDEFNDLLARQLSSVQVGSPTWVDCLEKSREHAAFMCEVGVNFVALVRVIRLDGTPANGEAATASTTPSVTVQV